jgi:hypothetical protein
MAGIEIIGMDLPPIPDPALILDYTIKPVIKILKDVAPKREVKVLLLEIIIT